MAKYFDRIYREAQHEFVKPYRWNLPLIEAITVMVIISRAVAESIEIFPYSVSRPLVEAANRWAYTVAPIIDRFYGALGYPFSPDVALMHRLPAENPTYPLSVWMISLWSFSVIYTFAYWIGFTALTYIIGRIVGGRGTFLRLLALTGIAHIAMINWWFYVGCEMMYEIVRQKIYLSAIPPYYESAVETKVTTPWGTLPNFVPIEGFWIGYGFGVAFMILTIALIYGLTKRELRLGVLRTILAITPWIVYLALLVAGSMNIDQILFHLNEYVSEGAAWRWAG